MSIFGDIAGAIAGPIIGAGSSLLGSSLEADAAKSLNQQQLDFAEEQFEWQKDYIQNRVADAEKAGIHPLYALGQPGVSASFQTSPSGTSIGSGIARAGEHLAHGVSKLSKNPMAQLQAELIRAQTGEVHSRTALNEAEAIAVASRAKRQEQDALVRRDTPQAQTLGLGPEDKIRYRELPSVVMGTAGGVPDAKRPTEITPSQDVGVWGEAVMGDGTVVPWMNAQAGEELAQVVNGMILGAHESKTNAEKSYWKRSLDAITKRYKLNRHRARRLQSLKRYDRIVFANALERYKKWRRRRTADYYRKTPPPRGGPR